MSTIVIGLDEAIQRGLIPRGRDTLWNNPLKQTQTLEFSLGPVTQHTRMESEIVDGRIMQRPTSTMRATTVRVEIPPGETVRIPSRWDGAIHVVHNGSIVGGLAPQLRREGQIESVALGLTTPGAVSTSATKRRLIED